MKKIVIIIIFSMLMSNYVLSYYDNEIGGVKPTHDAVYNDEPLEKLGFFERIARWLVFVSPMSCTQTDSVRVDYKEGVKSSGTRVVEYGNVCDVGDRIVLVACDGAAGTYLENTCQRLFTDDYLKESSDDRLDLRVECANGDCYYQSWYTAAIANKYVGYNCIMCGDYDKCDDDLDCSVGERCEDTICVETEQCYYAGIWYDDEICRVDGLGIIRCYKNANYESDCGINKGCVPLSTTPVCVDNAPSPVCTPNTKSCVDINTYKKCSSDGSGYVNYDCESDEECKLGNCVKKDVTDLCENKNCDDNNKCTIDGCSNGVCSHTQKSCTTGQICNDETGLCEALGECTFGTDCTPKLGFIVSCESNKCSYTAIVEPDDKFNWQQFYDNHTVEVWIVFGTLVLLIGLYIYKKNKDSVGGL